ncbi:MAG: endospore germination permease, partial [Candidatus Pacebacteria bacterium]|nr:endospore germination permease [Candidatus Paceibacterota bacterium]
MIQIMPSVPQILSLKQIRYSVLCFIFGSIPITSFFVGVTKQESWIVVIIGYVVSLLVISMYLYMARQYPGMNMIDIHRAVFGHIIGNIFSVILLLFFLSLAFLNLNTIGDFMTNYIMPETPEAAFLIIFILVCSFAVRSGFTSIIRLSFIFVVIIILVVAFNTLMLLKDMDFNNLLPVFQLPLKSYIQATHSNSIIIFCETVVFFMFVPFINDSKKIRKPMMLGLTYGAVVVLIMVLRDALVLGNAYTFVSIPSYEAIRLINISDILARFESFYTGVLLIAQFIKVCILYYAVVFGFTQLLGLKSEKTLVFPIGAVIVCFASIAFESAMGAAFWGQNVATVYSTFFEVAIPFIVFV